MGAFILTNKALVSSTFIDQYFEDGYIRKIEMEIESKLKTEHYVLEIMRERLCKGVGLLYVGILTSMVVLYYVLKFVWSLVSNFCSKVCCRCFIKSREQNEEAHNKYMEELQAQGLDSTSNDIFRDLRIGTLKDYYMKALIDLKSFQDKPQLLQKDLQKSINSHLTRRLNSVKSATNHHIELLIEETRD